MKWIENHGWKPVKDIDNVYADGSPATLVTWNSDDVVTKSSTNYINKKNCRVSISHI